MDCKTSRIKGFYKKSHDQRLEVLREFSALADADLLVLKHFCAVDFESANRMIENVISVLPMPLGVATNFVVNGAEYVVPMAIEESSVVAAASYAAKLARVTGGFTSRTFTPFMIGQVQIKGVSDMSGAVDAIKAHKAYLLDLANCCDPVLLEVGGGARDIVCRPFRTSRGNVLMVHVLVDVKDAMGANIVNTMAERISDELARLAGGVAGLRIVSNLAVHRMVHASAVWRKEDVGESVIEDILDAYALALVDPFRCSTHNKGIMNGIDAVAIATGNDFRAIEAGAHAYASLDGVYKPLTRYFKDHNGDLVGQLELPLAVGIVGGIVQCHPVTKICLKILGVQSASELACVMGAVGLAQNFAALRALVCEGISKGHMRLHSKNVAMNAGVPRELVDFIAERMIEEGDISIGKARDLLCR